MHSSYLMFPCIHVDSIQGLRHTVPILPSKKLRVYCMPWETGYSLILGIILNTIPVIANVLKNGHTELHKRYSDDKTGKTLVGIFRLL